MGCKGVPFFGACWVDDFVDERRFVVGSDDSLGDGALLGVPARAGEPCNSGDGCKWLLAGDALLKLL
eukprot:scaffold3851_cov387-Prasinococcus_capsulatus_cf.AAC.9